VKVEQSWQQRAPHKYFVEQLKLMCQQIEKRNLCVQDAAERSIFDHISFSSSYLSLQLERTSGMEMSRQQEVATSFATQQLDDTTS
jgi:uncharacterized protein (DUF2342 family)